MPFSSAPGYVDTSPTSLVAPYDEVTVVSQRSLNALFKKAFDETPALHQVSYKALNGDDGDDFSGCDIIFDAPKIELQISTESKPYIDCLNLHRLTGQFTDKITVLLLNIRGGNLKYIKVAGRNVSYVLF